MNKPKIVVTRKWPAAIEAKLMDLYDVQLNPTDKPMTVDELKGAMKTADALLSTVTDPLSAEIFGVVGKTVKIVGNFGVGYNNIDINAAKKNNVVVTNTPGVLTDCTADIAMLLLLTSARRGSEGDRLVRQQQWTGWSPTQLMGTKVTGKILGLIGFGRIGQAMAKKAHHGFDMKIIYYTPRAPAQEVIDDLQATRCESIEELLSLADFVSIHCPGGEANRHLINTQALQLMQPSAHLINTARGDIVDSKALIKALKENWIAGAGLDVFEGEPNIDPGFLELDNVSLLPHIGSASHETRMAMGNRVLDNINAFFAGEQPGDRVA